MTPVTLSEMLPNLVGLHAVTVPGKYLLGAYYPYARTEPRQNPARAGTPLSQPKNRRRFRAVMAACISRLGYYTVV